MSGMQSIRSAMAVLALFVGTFCAYGAEQVVVYTPAPPSLTAPLVEAFEQECGVEVKLYVFGTGELLRRLRQERELNEADVLWTGSLATVLPQQELFEVYDSPNEARFQTPFKHPDSIVTAFSELPSVLMVNDEVSEGVEIRGYADLLKPELKGRIAMADPARASSAYEQLLNMLYAMGNGDPERGWEYVEAFCRNLDGRLLASSSEVFRGVADGDFAVGLTHEEGGLKYAAADPEIRVVYMSEGVISRADGVYLVRGARHREQARQFIDYVTSRRAQELLASQLYRRSVRDDVPPPPGVPDKASLNIIYDNFAEELQKKEARIARFSEIFTKVSSAP